MQYSDKQINDLIQGIFDGEITEYDLPVDYYNAVTDYLQKGLFKGFGQNLEQASGKDLELLDQLNQNVYMFGAAKTFQQTKEMSALLVDGDRVRTMDEFNKVARETYDNWNNNWGKTEYITAIGQAQSASKWNEIEKQKDILPVLRYSTIGDACVICAPLDGLTAPVDDPVWDNIMPLNHFRCECLVTQHEEGETDLKGYDKSVENMDDTFKNNPGKTGMVFTKDHPYFDVAKADKEFAKQNFGLPLPEEVKEAKKFGTYKEAQEWFKSNPPSKEEKEAIKDYTSMNYEKINGFLRKGGKEFKTDKVEKTIKDLTNYINNSPKCDFLTFRGLSFNDNEYEQFKNSIQKGSIIEDKGFMSTSASKSRLTGSSVFSNLTANGAEINVYGKTGVNIGNDHKEILFKPGTRFRVIGVKEKIIEDQRMLNINIIEL